MRDELIVDDFTIISNNCWAGMVYESYGLKKLSPTVGMFIMPSDYVRLAAELPYYLTKPLEFIEPRESKWRNILSENDNWGKHLIGCIDDIELHMFHYRDWDVARRKWESRLDWINWNHILYIFNDQNGAEESDLVAFDALALEHKVIFTAQEHFQLVSCVRLHCPRSHNYLRTSYEPFGHNKAFDVTRYINESFGPCKPSDERRRRDDS